MAITLKVNPETPGAPRWKFWVYLDGDTYFATVLTNKGDRLTNIANASFTVTWVQKTLFETCHVFKTKEQVRILIAECLSEPKS